MSWNREGQKVIVKYYENTVYGTVIGSRVKYGGQIQHHIEIDDPLELFGTTREHILVEEPDIVSVRYITKN